MGDVIVRKCNACKGEIVISRSSNNTIYYDKMYYHKDCFHELATKRSQSKRGKPEKWMTALSHIDVIEADTKKMLENAWIKEDLNAWLLDHYNVTTVPSRLWQILADLDCGVYKGKKCKPVTMDVLLGAWKWGQKKLDSISRNNKMNNKGPASDDARIMYDCSIIVSKIPNYLSHKSKMKMLQVEEKRESEKTHINYDNVQQTKIESNGGLNDISDLLDDMF